MHQDEAAIAFHGKHRFGVELNCFDGQIAVTNAHDDSVFRFRGDFEDGRQFEHHMYFRAYSLHELGKILTGHGMRVLEVSGSRETRGRFYGATSPEIWLVAQRREDS